MLQEKSRSLGFSTSGQGRLWLLLTRCAQCWCRRETGENATRAAKWQSSGGRGQGRGCLFGNQFMGGQGRGCLFGNQFMGGQGRGCLFGNQYMWSRRRLLPRLEPEVRNLRDASGHGGPIYTTGVGHACNDSHACHETWRALSRLLERFGVRSVQSQDIEPPGTAA